VVRIALLAGLVLGVLSGCAGAGGDDAAGEVTIDARRYGDSRQFSATIDRRFCDAANGTDSVCALGSIYLASIAPSGKVFVADQSEIIAFDDAGVPHAISRQGNGPGELRAPFAMRSDGAGRVHVFDIRRMRYLVFPDTGTVTDVGAIPPTTMLNLKFGDAGLHVFSLPSAAAQGDTVTGFIIRRTVTDTSWIDTVARVPEHAVFAKGAEGLFAPSLPWDRAVFWDVCGEGSVVVAASDGWRVVRYQRGRTMVTTRRPEVVGRAVTAAERDSVLQAVMARSRPPKGYLAALEQKLGMPGRHRVIQDLHCTDDGRVYLRNAPAPGATVVRWDVLGADGAPLGYVSLPAAFRILDVRGNRVVGVQELDSGVEQVIAMRVE